GGGGRFGDDRAVAHDDAADCGLGRGVTARGTSDLDRPLHRFVVAHWSPLSTHGARQRQNRPRPVAWTTAAAETLSHPDSHRRPRTFTWSAPRWLRGVRGLSPPVGTFTQPRGHACSCSRAA